jgi:hypothetical protein
LAPTPWHHHSYQVHYGGGRHTLPGNYFLHSYWYIKWQSNKLHINHWHHSYRGHNGFAGQNSLSTIIISPATLSQKQFGKYLSAEIFPASMGILPVLF